MSAKKEYTGKDVIIQNMPNVFEEIVKGTSIVNICKMLGISRQTWYNLVNENVQFKNMIKEAEEIQKLEIKTSLISKCQDRRIIKERVLPNGKRVKYEEFIPADFNAIKFYLLNKLPDEFKDKQEITVKNTHIEVMIDDVDYTVNDDNN